MSDSQTSSKQAFVLAFGKIIRALRDDADQEIIQKLLYQASEQLSVEHPLHLHEITNELKLDYHATLHLLHNKLPKSELVLAAIYEWDRAQKLTAPGIEQNLTTDVSADVKHQLKKLI